MKLSKGKVLVEREGNQILKSGLILPQSLALKYGRSVVLAVPEDDSYAYPKVGSVVTYSKMYESWDHTGNTTILDAISIIAYEYQGEIRVPELFVGVVIENNFSEYKIEGAGSIVIDTSFHKEQYAPTFAKVFVVPDRLPYEGKESFDSMPEKRREYVIQRCMPWRCEMEVLPGDTVYFHYLSVLNAENAGLVAEYDGKKVVFIKYSDIYARERDFERKTVNGYLLVSIEDTKKEVVTESGIIVVSLTEKSRRKKYGEATVIYPANRNQEYFDDKYFDPYDEINIGDRIIIPKSKRSKVIQDLYSKGNPFEGLYMLQLKDVIAVHEV